MFCCPTSMADAPPTLFFDVNETSLDIITVFSAIDKVLGSGGGLTWFDRLIQMSFCMAHVNQYDGFAVLSKAAFKAVCEAKGVVAGDAEWGTIAPEFTKMVPHPEVVQALEAFKANGWRLIAFSNHPLSALEAVLKGGGIYDKFDGIVSVDGAKNFKPHLDTYRHALGSTGSSAATSVMIACHDWDLAGANAVGMKTAFVKRKGCVMGSAYVQPEYMVDDFMQLVPLIGKAK
mmetsp:Transcript_42169/g.68306  ORF Transcript_42169/g.68306 Transcript_42169/m.68306 type:complete len:232 (+) Transcript_42169:17-712(+)